MIKILIDGKQFVFSNDILDQISLVSEIDNKGILHSGSKRAMSFNLPAVGQNVEGLNCELSETIVEVGGNEIFVGIGKLDTIASTSKMQPMLSFQAWAAAKWSQALNSPICDYMPEPFVWSKANIDNTMLQTASVNPYDAGFDVVYYPVVYGGQSYGRWNYADMLPHLPILQILEKFFCACGITIKSEFLFSDYFKRLTIPFVWGRFGNNNEYYKNNVNAYIGQQGIYGIYSLDPAIQHIFPMNFNNQSGIYYDNGGNFNTLNYTYTFPENGVYCIAVDMQTNFVMTYNTVRFYAVIDGVEITQGAFFTNDSLNTSISLRFDNMTFLAGQTITFNIAIESYHYLYGYDPSQESILFGFEFYDASLLIEKKPRYEIGDTINFKRFISDEIPISKLWGAIKKRYNLHTEYNEAKGIVCIEPKFNWQENTGEIGDGFISENMGTINLDEKIDYSVQYTKKVFDSIKQIQCFRHQSDSKDAYLTNIENTYVQTPHKVRYNFSERYGQGEDTTKDDFAPTVHTIIGGAQYPVMIREANEEIGTGTITKELDFSAWKILYYAGEASGNWGFNATVLTTYPKAFFVDYLDENGTSPNLGYANLEINGNDVKGLFDIYHHRSLFSMRGKYWENINLLLSNTDFATFTHRQPFAIEGMRYFVSAIKNFRPTSECSTKIRAYKIDYPTIQDCDNVNNSSTPTLVTLPVDDCECDLRFSCETKTVLGVPLVCITARVFNCTGRKGPDIYEWDGTEYILSTYTVETQGYTRCTQLPLDLCELVEADRQTVNITQSGFDNATFDGTTFVFSVDAVTLSNPSEYEAVKLNIQNCVNSSEQLLRLSLFIQSGGFLMRFNGVFYVPNITNLMFDDINQTISFDYDTTFVFSGVCEDVINTQLNDGHTALSDLQALGATGSGSYNRVLTRCYSYEQPTIQPIKFRLQYCESLEENTIKQSDYSISFEDLSDPCSSYIVTKVNSIVSVETEIE